MLMDCLEELWVGLEKGHAEVDRLTGIFMLLARLSIKCICLYARSRIYSALEVTIARPSWFVLPVQGLNRQCAVNGSGRGAPEHHFT